MFYGGLLRTYAGRFHEDIHLTWGIFWTVINDEVFGGRYRFRSIINRLMSRCGRWSTRSGSLSQEACCISAQSTIWITGFPRINIVSTCRLWLNLASSEPTVSLNSLEALSFILNIWHLLAIDSIVSLTDFRSVPFLAIFSILMVSWFLGN